MERIIGPRASGKTTKLIELALNNNFASIVVPNHRMAEYVSHMAAEKGYPGLDILTFNQFMRRYYDGRPGRYVIDELDLCLAANGVLGYTNSEED